MPLSKQYCIGENADVTHNSTLDVSQLVNTAAGITSGAFIGEGWSIPPPSSNNLWRPYYPAQRPFFYEKETTIKLPEFDWSMKSFLRVEYPTPRSDSALSLRNEIYTKHPDAQRKKIAFKLSVYRPSPEPYDPFNRCHIFQHRQSGSPAFSIYEGRSGWIEFRMQKSGANADTLFFPIAEFTRDTWHEMTVFLTVGTTSPSGSDSGRATVWYGNKLARFHNRSGTAPNHTYSKAVVPQNSDSAYGVNPALGTTPITITEDDNPVTLFDYHGVTHLVADNLSDQSIKWGFYKSDIGNIYYSVPVALARFQSGDHEGDTMLETAANCVLVNPDNPDAPNYVPEDARNYTIYSHMNFAYWGEGETDEDIWKLLNNGESPLEAPDDFTFNSVGEEFELTVLRNNNDWGTVNIAGGTFEVGQSITLTATPASGYRFVEWRQGSSFLNNTASFNYVMPSTDITLTAVFELAPTPNPSGKIRLRGRFAQQPIT
jgi:hypothetical protein